MRIVGSKAIFRGFPYSFHRQPRTEAAAIKKCPHQPEGSGIIGFALDIGEIWFD